MGSRPVFNNFDLYIGRGRNGVYPISVHYSPAGETPDSVQVPIAHNDELMRRWLRCLQDGFIERDDLLALGRRLAGYLLPPGLVRDLYQRSRGMTDAQNLNLRLRLRISPPELAALPWEYTYDEDSADFFVLNPSTVLVRYHGQPIPPYSIVSHAPVPILVLISNPPDTSLLGTVKETRNLIKALGRLLDEDQVRVDVLFSGLLEERRAIEALAANQAGTRLLPGPASVDALRDALRQGYRVIHYIGHGEFDERIGGVLLLVNDEGDETRVGAQTLARELRGSSAAVVVLNACKSATESTARSFMGLAPSLIRAGVPAVVAMQYAIVDSSSVYFSHALYKALADGWPLDAAVTEGRKAISAQVTADDMDWGIPVLFMRSSDGVLWKEESGEIGENAIAPEVDSRVGSQVGEHSGGVNVGDIITIGAVGPSAAVAAGRGASATVTADVSGGELHQLFAPLMDALRDAPPEKRGGAVQKAEALKSELAKGKDADDTVVARLVDDLVGLVPDVVGTVVSMFASPILAGIAGPVTKYAVGRIQGK